MRIAYIADWDASTESGVLKKMTEQVRLWHDLGNDVGLFLMSPVASKWPGLNGIPVSVVRGANPIGRSLAYRALVRVASSWSPDIAYHRFFTYRPGLRSLQRRVPTVLEINTDDVSEYRLYLDAIRYHFHVLTRSRILSAAAGLVCVTRELADRFSSFARPAKVIANGIDLSTFPILPPSPSSGVRFVFIGSPDSAWHGVDKIIELARQRPDWHFDLVGSCPDPSLPSNVRAHGTLSRAEYAPLCAQADVAISTMALHRKGMTEACPLKLREYLACGLPCILGYTDTDFPNGANFLLQLPNEEDNLLPHISSIDDFAKNWKGRRVSRSDIAHLDSATKEAIRLEFLRSVFLANSKHNTSSPSRA